MLLPLMEAPRRCVPIIPLGGISSREITLAKPSRHNFWREEIVLTYFVIASARPNDRIYMRIRRKTRTHVRYSVYVYVRNNIVPPFEGIHEAENKGEIDVITF